MPDISVVIPTHDRPAGLARLLQGLREQTLAGDRFEAIVVDDGSAQPVSPEPDGLHLSVVRHEQPRGPAAARNSGWRRARADTVVFIDDDCTPAAGWLEAVLRAADGGETVVQGAVAPTPGQARHPLSHTVEVGGLSPLFVSANIAYPRALLERLNGFDERFRRACAEDVELGARATKAGAVVRFASDALVFHEVRELSLVDQIRHTFKWTDAASALSLHPELRSLLRLRVFWKATHPWLIAALAGQVSGHRRLAAAAFAGYLLHYVRVYRSDLGNLWRALPEHLIIDASEIATAVAGSIRHGSLML